MLVQKIRTVHEKGGSDLYSFVASEMAVGKTMRTDKKIDDSRKLTDLWLD